MVRTWHFDCHRPGSNPGGAASGSISITGTATVLKTASSFNRCVGSNPTAPVYAVIAQSVVHLPCKQRVVGSIPTGGFIGRSYSGSTSVSKTDDGGSIPSLPVPNTLQTQERTRLGCNAGLGPEGRMGDRKHPIIASPYAEHGKVH